MRRALVGSIVRYLDVGYKRWRSVVQGVVTTRLAQQRAVVRWTAGMLRSSCHVWHRRTQGLATRRSLAQQGVALLSSRRLTMAFNAWLFSVQTGNVVRSLAQESMKLALDAHREWRLREGWHLWEGYQKRAARKTAAGDLRKSLVGRKDDPAVQELLRQLQEVDSELRRTKRALSVASPRRPASSRDGSAAR